MKSWPHILLACGLALAGLVLLAVYGTRVVRQQDRMTRYLSAPATIERSEVRVRRGSKSTSYTPMIEYRYEVDGTPRRGSTILPANETWSRSGANEVTSAAPPGAASTAYYDPADPSQSYLFKRYAFEPYAVSMLAGVLIAGAGLAWYGKRDRPGMQSRATPLRGGDGEWWPLAPEYAPARALAKWRWTAVAMVVFTTVPIHYLSVARPDLGTFASVLCGAFLAACVVCVGLWARAASVNRRFVEPVVLVDRPDPTMGELFCVRVSLSVLRGIARGELRVGMRCRESYREKRGGKMVTGERTRFELPWESEPIEDLQPEGVLTQDFEFEAPLLQPASNDPELLGKAYPHHTWLVRVRCRVRNGADFAAEYPVYIDPGFARNDEPG